MSKKGQTSGLPKAPPPDSNQSGKKQPRLIREYKSKAERDAAVQRYLLIGTGVVIAIAAAFIIIALVGAAVTPSQTAATVNGQTITVGELQTAVRLERAIRNLELNNAVAQYQALGATDDQINQLLTTQPPFSTWISEESVPEQLGSSVLRDLIQARLIQTAASELNVAADEAAIQKRIEQFFGYDPEAALTTPTASPSPTASPTPLVSPTPTVTPSPTVTPEFTPTASLTPVASGTPTPTPNATEIAQQFTTVRDDFFAAMRSLSGLSDADINAYFVRQALAEALRDQVTADLSREATFVNARVIEVASEQEASDVLAALAAGESFANLARANSQHESATTGGELDWQSLSQIAATFGAESQTALSEAQPGATVGPIVTSNGTWVVFQVRGSEQRTMSDAEFEQAQAVAFEEYLTNLTDGADVNLTDAWISHVPAEPRLAIRSAQ